MSAESLTLIAGGDVAPGAQPVDRMAELVLPVLRTADFRFAQCERTFSKRGVFPEWTQIPTGRWSRLDPENASVYRAAGIDAVSFASNHTLDWGYDAMFDTIDLLREMGIQVGGAGRNSAEARQPVILEKNGVKLGILSYCSVVRDGQTAGPELPGLAAIRARTAYELVDWQPGTPPLIRTWALDEDLQAAAADIAHAKEQADVVAVSLHWGIRHVPKILAEYQQPTAHAIIDAGADIIIGHHAHTPKAIEEYRDAVIFYSVGNFMTTSNTLYAEQPKQMWNTYWYDGRPEGSLYGFPQNCRNAILARVEFDKAGVRRVAAIPIYMNDLAQPEPLNDADPRYGAALQHLEWVSDQMKHTFNPRHDEIDIWERANA